MAKEGRLRFVTAEMMKKLETLGRILESGVVAVIRAENEAEAERIANACIRGGIRAIEITMTVPRALEAIRSLKRKFSAEQLIIGAGSVLDSETARLAILEGAEYVVSPGFNRETAFLCNRYQVPYMPGCMTVTEIMTAMEHGASIIKLFPGNAFGPGMLKALKGPLPQVPVMPTGGVNLQNVGEWIQSGAVAVGVGSELTKPAKEGKYEEIARLAAEFVRAVHQARGSARS